MSGIHFVGPEHALDVFGIKLVGINANVGKKILFSIVLIAIVMLLSKLLRLLAHSVSHRRERINFWIRQGIHVLAAIILVVGLLSIWFDQPSKLASALGLASAGLAFALQRVITSLAGYVVILNGKNFNVGDRIVMGGVRGDVVALGFTQTTIMEMGQPPGEQADAPSMWVKARQYTGRMVSVPNAIIFDEPVYNYTRDFPYIWEEMSLPISYRDDRNRVEQILLDTAKRHTINIEQLSEPDITELKRRYVMQRADIKPHVFWRMTDNWIELTVRFICKDHGVRALKDAMTRDILGAMDEAKIGVGSSTSEVMIYPPLKIDPSSAITVNRGGAKEE